jgi:23S rRNA pseudouridine1911/1915/1917 synthase
MLRASTRLRAGERVEVRLPTPPAAPSELAFTVVYEDRHLLAVDKPAGLVVYPTRRHLPSGALVTEVHRRYRESGEMPPSPCHRLDRETSGLVLFARTLEARREIGRALEERRLEKVYLAVIDGELDGDEGVIDLPLGRAEGSAVRVRQGERRDGAPAMTAWRRLARRGTQSLLELRPRSGRPHQLRAHLAAAGCPILGDKLYRGGDAFFLRFIAGRASAKELAALGAERHALHAWRLCFEHPISGRPLRLEAPLPADLGDWRRLADR